MENLSQNAILDIFRGRKNFAPILQVVHIQPMAKRQSAQDRYIIILSDSKHHMEAVCTNNLGNLIKTGQLKNFEFIRLLEFITNTSNSGKLVIVALKGEIIGSNPGKELGNSVSVNEASKNQQNSSKPSNFNQNQRNSSNFNQNQQNSSNFNQNQQKIGQNSAIKRQRVEDPFDYEGGVFLNEQNIVPVSSLNPYRGKWVIKVRCTAKSDIRTWQKPTGSGKLMSVDLLDDMGTEIRATMFNDAVDKFENVFAVDNVYLISRARIKMANRKFTHIRNDYEITLDSDSIVKLAQDDQSISRANFEFTAVKDIEGADENSFVDVIGVVSRVDPVASILSSKLNKYLDKRNILICDRTASIEVTIWGELASKYDEEILKGEPIIAIKAARVSHFSGRTLSLSSSSTISINPDMQEVYRLKTWWQGGGKQSNLPAMSSAANSAVGTISSNDQRVDLSDIKDKQLGLNNTGAADFIVVLATIMNIRHDFTKPPFYWACTRQRDGRVCNKKAARGGGNSAEDFWCEICSAATEARPRYILNLSLNDYSGSHYANCFDEVGERLLGKSAADLARLCEGTTADETAFSKVFLEASFKSKLFKLKAKSENYLDEERVRCTILAVDEIDYVKESIRLIERLNRIL